MQKFIVPHGVTGLFIHRNNSTVVVEKNKQKRNQIKNSKGFTNNECDQIDSRVLYFTIFFPWAYEVMFFHISI